MHSQELIRKVSHAVRASREDIEDACTLAWIQFIRYQPDRDREYVGWLFRTAQRAAWKMNARHTRDVGIVGERELDVRTVTEPEDPHDRHEERLEFQAALQELRKLPPRLQEVVLIRSQVSTQEQVAEVMGISRPRVAQMLRDAGLHLQEVSERRIEAQRPVAHRAPRGYGSSRTTRRPG